MQASFYCYLGAKIQHIGFVSLSTNIRKWYRMLPFVTIRARTVETLFTDTFLIRTPLYTSMHYKKFTWSQRNQNSCSLYLYIMESVQKRFECTYFLGSARTRYEICIDAKCLYGLYKLALLKGCNSLATEQELSLIIY